jgi:hypothetical protein
MKISLLLVLLLLPVKAAAAEWIELTAAEQLALAMTVLNEAGGEGQRGQVAVAKVVLFRARIAGESVGATLRVPQQFAGYRGAIAANRAADLVATLGLVWDVAAGKYGNYGPYTNFRPTGKAPKSWYKQSTTVDRIGGHEFFVLPYKVAARKNAGTMLRNLAASSPALARMIFPHREKIEIAKR